MLRTSPAKNGPGATDVLLTYGWVRSSYAALRNLASHGLRVAVADSRQIGMCQWSRYRSHSYRYESPYRDETKFIESLLSIVNRCSPRILLPSHDETEIIARHRDAFPSSVAIPISSADQLALANDKYQMQLFANQTGIPTPRMLVYNDLEQLSTLLA